MNPRTSNAAAAALSALVLSLGLFLSGCGKDKSKKDNSPIEDPRPKKTEEPKGPPIFEDVTRKSGIDFTYKNGDDCNHLAILESLGGGIGLIDYDQDGLLDVFIPAGGGFDKKVALPKNNEENVQSKKDAAGTNVLGRPCKLYRNMGNFQFKDVSEEVLQFKDPWPFSHGAAVADYDRDGWPDVLVTGFDRLILFHNEADPKNPKKRILVDRTEQAGLHKAKGWSSSAAWADLDGDGYPDLFVAYYADWSFQKHPSCNYDGKTPDICPPKQFHGTPDKLFLNKGNGTFADVGKEAGLMPGGHDSDKGLAVLIADVNGDGKPDIYVANDTVDNFLYINQSQRGQLKFLERGFATSTARDDKGAPNGSMGLDCADYDGCGRPSIFVTNYEAEKHALYHNDFKPGGDPVKDLFFSHRTAHSRIAAIGQSYVGWGTGFVDLEHRGWEDLVIINGHVIRFPSTPGSSRPQRPVLLHNEGNGTFSQHTSRGGDFFQEKHNGRGVAFGDLDNDGKVDMIVNCNNDPVKVVRNIAKTDNHWLGIELKAKDKGDIVGAKIGLEQGKRTQWRFCKGGGSYGSTRDPRHVFGLGETDKPGKLTVYWANGDKQTFEDLKADRYYRISQGSDKPEETKYP